MSQSDTDAARESLVTDALPEDAERRPLNDVLDIELPADVSSAFQNSLDADRTPRTLSEWAGLLHDVFGEWPPAVADLCHDVEGKHRADVAEQSFRFACVLDAMLLPFLRDDPATITSRVPGQDAPTDVTFRVTQSDVTGSPDAVMSFGAAVRPPQGEVTPAHAYGVICPFIHTFPSQAAYEEWTADVDGATMALSLPDAMGLARAMVYA